jgi:hypothetical protein
MFKLDLEHIHALEPRKRFDSVRRNSDGNVLNLLR